MCLREKKKIELFRREMCPTWSGAVERRQVERGEKENEYLFKQKRIRVGKRKSI